ncbi:hypothetical protein, partial [Dietzia sp. HMSC21D01]
MPTTPKASGYLSPTGAVVFPRRLPLSVEEAWAAVTDPARTAPWIGPWSGDPATGTVELTMIAEDGAPVVPVGIVRCEAPHLVVVTTAPDGWVLTVRIEGDDDEVVISPIITPACPSTTGRCSAASCKPPGAPPLSAARRVGTPSCRSGLLV